MINEDNVKDIKLAVDQLYTTPHGKELIEFLEVLGGKYEPQYDGSSQSSINIAMGRSEVIQTLRNLHRLEPEQILQYYDQQEGY